MTDTDADDGTTWALTGDDLEYEEFEEEWDWDDGLDMAVLIAPSRGRNPNGALASAPTCRVLIAPSRGRNL